jgi:hypothetical protein
MSLKKIMWWFMGNVKRIPARAQVSKDGLPKDGLANCRQLFPGTALERARM